MAKFQDVTYSGFEKHPERLAWVKRALMPLAEEALREDSESLTLHWLHPDLPGADKAKIDEIVRRVVVPERGATPLSGEIYGEPVGADVYLHLPGVVLVLTSPRHVPGWTYLPIPGAGDAGDAFRLKWAMRSIHLTMLQNTLKVIVDGFDRGLATAGV